MVSEARTLGAPTVLRPEERAVGAANEISPPCVEETFAPGVESHAEVRTRVDVGTDSVGGAHRERRNAACLEAHLEVVHRAARRDGLRGKGCVRLPVVEVAHGQNG